MYIYLRFYGFLFVLFKIVSVLYDPRVIKLKQIDGCLLLQKGERIRCKLCPCL